jgi:hypothetical protein
MITDTTSQLDMQQSTVKENKNSRSMSFRSMLPTLLMNAVVPLSINLIARPYMPTIDALLLASSVPALFTLGSFIWKKHIDAVGLIVVGGLLLTAVFALVFKSPRLLLLQSSAVSGLFGMAMLVSLLFSRPILFYIVRSISAQNDAQRIASFNADWSFPQFRAFFRTLTIVWGCVTIAQLALLTILVFNLPISLMLALAPFMGFLLVIPAAYWSIHYFRKNKRFFNQLRQQREANALKSAC